MPSSALLQPDSALALATLAVLEIVLGIDNLVVLSILVGHVPSAQRRAARLIGLSLAMLTRLALLFAVVWLIGLTVPLFTLAGHGFSLRDLILGVGGLVLMAQSVTEIHETLEGAGEVPRLRQGRTLLVVVTQIALIDIIFSLDSVFTAVGLARPDQVLIMAAAIVLAMIVMMWASGLVTALIDRHPTIKVLALSFLVLIGSALIGQALGLEVPKGYLYFAMGFAVAVELINIRVRAGQTRARRIEDDSAD
jgi:predicted tellurium resistance membrane protein TerC